MQAKADPKQIRRAAREREEQAREREREQDLARRQEFERGYYARDAVQQERTSQVNAQARRQWAEVELPPVQQPCTEPVMPDEEVDFGQVRRQLAAKERERRSQSPRSHTSGHILGTGEGTQEVSNATSGSRVRS